MCRDVSTQEAFTLELLLDEISGEMLESWKLRTFCKRSNYTLQ